MLKNLFFKECITFIKALLSFNKSSSRKIVFFLLLSLNFFKAVPLEVELPVQDPQAIIYVSGNAQIYGNLNTSVVIAKDKIESTRVTNVPHKVKKQHNQVELANVAKKESYEKLAAKIASKKKPVFYTSNPSDNLSTQQLKLITSAVAVAMAHNFNNFNAVIPEITSVILLIAQSKKQKYYTSLSYLQFGKYRSSSLRGPPTWNFES